MSLKIAILSLIFTIGFFSFVFTLCLVLNDALNSVNHVRKTKEDE